MLLAPVLLMSFAAFGGDKPAACELVNKSILTRSAAGVAQVSNLGDIEISCRVPARPFPTQPGETHGLTAETMVYEASPNGSKKLVPSDVQLHGARRAPDQEEVAFYLRIPLDTASREAEVRRYLAKIQNSMPDGQLSEEARRGAIKRLQPLVYQHRVGRFHVECRVLDGKRVIGTGSVELEVLFKGRFSDVGLPGAPPA
jgi:hypothetical protein